MEASGQKTKDERTETAEKKSTLWIMLRKEAILVGLATVVGYSVAFLYQMGFCYYFGIPINMISVGLPQLMICAGLLLAIGYTIFIGLPLALSLSKLSKLPSHSTWTLTSILGIPTFITWIFFDGGIYYFIILMTSFAILQVILQYYLKHKTNNSEPNPFRSTYIFTTLIIATIVHIFTLVYFYGSYSAETRSDYVVTDSKPELVVLRTYGDQMIASEFDREAGTVSRKFTILNKSEVNGQFKLGYEDVGPLEPAPTED